MNIIIVMFAGTVNGKKQNANNCMLWRPVAGQLDGVFVSGTQWILGKHLYLKISCDKLYMYV